MKCLPGLLIVLSFGAVMTLSGAAQEQNTGAIPSNSGKQSAGIGDTDTTFVQKAAQGGIAEVELGQLAAQKASSEDVKKFGQKMVDDHSKANDELKQLAAQEHIDLPQQMTAKDKATKARLEKLSGARFDRVYMYNIVKDHEKDVAEFERESQMAKDPALKGFAQQTLPTLREHLLEAQKIAPKQQQAERKSGE
jgi:putative membrane protein